MRIDFSIEAETAATMPSGPDDAASSAGLTDLITLVGQLDLDPAGEYILVADKIRSVVGFVLDRVDQPEAKHHRLNEKTVEAFAVTVSRVSQVSADYGRVAMWIRGTKISIEKQTCDALLSGLKVAYKEIGSMRGQVRLVGPLADRVFDIIPGAGPDSVQCEWTDPALDEVVLFAAESGRFVDAHGWLFTEKFNRWAHLMKVNKITLLPDPKDVPPLTSFRGYLKDAPTPPGGWRVEW